MIISSLLLAALTVPPLSIDVIDSRDDSRFVFVIVSDKCKVEIPKQELKDYDLVVQKVMQLCNISSR